MERLHQRCWKRFTKEKEKVGDLVCRGADWRRTGTEGVGGGGQAAREVSGFARMSSLNSDNVGGFFGRWMMVGGGKQRGEEGMTKSSRGAKKKKWPQQTRDLDWQAGKPVELLVMLLGGLDAGHFLGTKDSAGGC